MNKALFTLLCSALAATVSAQVVDNGYYRVKNLHRDRYVVVADNQSDGAIISQSTADLSAVRLRKGHDAAISDPGTVVYLEGKGGDLYDLTSQGTGVHAMIGYYPHIYEVSSGVYNVYATISGMGTKYLSDNDDTEDEYGIMDLDGKGDRRKWSAYPISSQGSEYFGIQPVLSAGGKYYTTFYAGFPFSFASAGMKAYAVQSVDYALGVAIYTEVTASQFPAATPLLIECSSNDPSSNRLDLLVGSYASVGNTLLKGCYFCYPFKRLKSKDAVTKNDPATMRVLSTLSDGSLAFVTKTTSQLQYMPANQCWLPVTADAPAQLKLVTPEEYVILGMDAIKAESAGTAGIYSLTGKLLSPDVKTLGSLPKGIYIVNGRKVVNM